MVVLRGVLPPLSAPAGLTYATRTGALLRLDGITAGAFDREHATIVVDACAAEREMILEVEERSLPSSGLPSGPGPAWRWMTLRAAQRPARRIVEEAPPRMVERGPRGPLALIGHAHLDLAWLWTFTEARRKARRTLENALQMRRLDPSFVFAQSQPATFAAIEADDPTLFAQVAQAVRDGAVDVSIAPLWAETDCTMPSGEALLRQILLGTRYIESRFGVEPQIAWLPDSFGFASTIPQLLAHAGLRFFMTTKLQWNDTTRWPHPRFVWRGPDGSSVIAAVMASYDGEASRARVAAARTRDEPLILGYGDGGGGPNGAMLRRSVPLGHWSSPLAWFETVAREAARLPRVDGELYLEFHRGIYTTHRDVKARRFALEAGFDLAEELAVWCLAVGAQPSMRAPIASDLRRAWPLLLEGDHHDPISGTAITAAYVELAERHARCEELIGRSIESARSVLPRHPRPREGRESPPERDGDGWVFANDALEARVRDDGTIVALSRRGGANLVAMAGVFAAYVDRPKHWEAWNIDAGYERHGRKVTPQGAERDGDALIVRYTLGSSTIVSRLSLADDAPYLRVDGAIVWKERRTLLRVEHWLAIEAGAAILGAPHGFVERSLDTSTPAERAKFEAPGQRWLRLDGPRGGLAIMVRDIYGWSARSLRDGGVHAGFSLLRGTSWPDPQADRGEHAFGYALMPLPPGAGIGVLERQWRAYAYPERVRLFGCEDPAVLVVAVKPAEDDDGAIVRVRECDGARRELVLTCAGRLRSVEACDARERPLERDAALVDGALRATLEAFELRTFRVRF